LLPGAEDGLAAEVPAVLLVEGFEVRDGRGAESASGSESTPKPYQANKGIQPSFSLAG
jgi:hypothetical protein